MRFRLASASNLAECRAIRHPADRISGCDDDRLIEVWRRLLENDPASFAVVEDPLQHWPHSLEGFLASVFVTDAFVEECTAARSSLSAAIYGQMVAGRSPVLTSAEVRTANSTHGLNLLLLHLAVRTADVSDRRTMRALRQAGAALFFLRAGYRLNVVMAEAFGREQANFMTAAGLRPLENASDASGGVRRPAEPRPSLFLMRKEWNEPAPLGQISMLFHAPPARLGLTRAEQRTVLGALLGMTDREIAATGDVSTDAVKKTWRRIHERMALAVPHLDEAARTPCAADRRSAEKRRRLIEYLRYHPEELRPAGGRAPGSLRHLPRS